MYNCQSFLIYKAMIKPVIDQNKIESLLTTESDRFKSMRPKSAKLLSQAKSYMPNGVPCAWMDGLYFHDTVFVSHGKGARFWDVDGHEYLDMNQADLSMNCGYGPDALVEAMRDRIARGSQFLLPVEESITAARLLSERYQLPFWQFTLSASSANVEAIRIARAYTGRSDILVFNGKYHGHIHETMAEPNSDSLGFVKGYRDHTIITEFNDIEAVEQAFKHADIACVITEPALTNMGVIKPEDNFLKELHTLCQNQGSLLILDETHTQTCAWGGLSHAWNLNFDMLTLGKTVAAGIPTGTYGMTAEVAAFVASHMESIDHNDPRCANGALALGGTLYGNALSVTAVNVALNEILTRDAYQHAATLGKLLINGIQQLFNDHQLPWTAQSLITRSGYTFGPELPVNAQQFARYENQLLRETIRVYMANRGIWEAISSAGPSVSFCMNDHDVEDYLDVFNDFLKELIS